MDKQAVFATTLYPRPLFIPDHYDHLSAFQVLFLRYDASPGLQYLHQVRDAAGV